MFGHVWNVLLCKGKMAFVIIIDTLTHPPFLGWFLLKWEMIKLKLSINLNLKSCINPQTSIEMFPAGLTKEERWGRKIQFTDKFSIFSLDFIILLSFPNKSTPAFHTQIMDVIKIKHFYDLIICTIQLPCWRNLCMIVYIHTSSCYCMKCTVKHRWSQPFKSNTLKPGNGTGPTYI